MGEIGVGIVLLILGFGLAFLINDFKKRYAIANKYMVCIKTGFEKCGLPLIRLKISGKNEWFLLDSGANDNYLRKSYYDRMTNKPEIIGVGSMHNSDSKISSEKIQVNLAYGKNTFPSTIFNVTSLATFDEPMRGYNIVGIVGSPFFNENRWVIDFEQLVVWIKNKKS